MRPKPFVIKPADRKAALNVLGTQVTILASGNESSDQYRTIIEWIRGGRLQASNESK